MPVRGTTSFTLARLGLCLLFRSVLSFKFLSTFSLPLNIAVITLNRKIRNADRLFKNKTKQNNYMMQVTLKEMVWTF